MLPRQVFLALRAMPHSPSFVSKVVKAMTHPGRLLAHCRRVLRNRRLHSEDPIEFYSRVEDDNYDFLPPDTFDCAYAHAVFTQVPIEVVKAVLAGVRRVLKPGGFFEFTFNASDGPARDYLREDFFYPEATILDAVEAQGMVP